MLLGKWEEALKAKKRSMQEESDRRKRKQADKEISELKEKKQKLLHKTTKEASEIESQLEEKIYYRRNLK